jgi:ethanolamine ammonia-lyase small subunit
MSKKDNGVGKGYVTPDPWEKLKEYTDARISMGRTGVSLPLKDQLKFNLDHAKAKDAVMLPYDSEGLALGLQRSGVNSIQLESRARTKDEYLARPDLGRRLLPESRARLEEAVKSGPSAYDDCDVLIACCDGLSALAMHTNALKCVVKFMDVLKISGLKAAPVAIVTRGRVAVADEVNDCVKARIVINLVGERPGLSSPDSMGAYITYGAYWGIMEESRNCISNIRPAGLSIDQAVQKLSYIVQKALAMKLTGTALKDDMPDNYLPFEAIPLIVSEK